MKDPPEGVGAPTIELIVAMNRFSDRVDALNKAGTHQNVTLSGGSLGVWVSAFCAAVTFLMFCVILVLFVNHDRKIDDLGDYLQAIYTQAPHLNPANQDERKEENKPD